MEATLYSDGDREAYRQFAARVLPENGVEPDFQGRHADMLDPASAYERIIILKEGDLVMGSVALRPLDESRGICEIKRLYVVNEAQGAGWGSLLMGLILDYAASQGYRFARLDTKDRFKAAIQLIEAKGFYRIGRYNESHSDRFYEIDLSQLIAELSGNKGTV